MKDLIPLVEQFRPHCIKLCKGDYDADDIMQDTYVKAIVAYKRYKDLPIDDKEKIIYRMMYNVFIDHCRAHKVRRFSGEIDIAKYCMQPDRIDLPQIIHFIQSSSDNHIITLSYFLRGYTIRELMIIFNQKQGTILGNIRYGKFKVKDKFPSIFGDVKPLDNHFRSRTESSRPYRGQFRAIRRLSNAV